MEKRESTETLPVSTTINQLTISRMLRREIAVCIDGFLENANELLMDGDKTKDGFDKNFFIPFLKQHGDKILNIKNKLLSGKDKMNVRNFGLELNKFLEQLSKDNNAQETERFNVVVNNAKNKINLIALMLKEIASAKEFDEIDLRPNLKETYESLKERFREEKVDTIRLVKTMEIVFDRNSVISGFLDEKIAELKESILGKIATAENIADKKIRELQKTIDKKIDVSLGTKAQEIMDTTRKETFATGEIMTSRILSKFDEKLSETAKEIIDKVNELLTREETDPLKNWIYSITKRGKTRSLLIKMAEKPLGTEFTRKEVAEMAEIEEKNLYSYLKFVLSRLDGEFALKTGKNKEGFVCFWFGKNEKIDVDEVEIETVNKFAANAVNKKTSQKELKKWAIEVTREGNTRKILLKMIEKPLGTRFASGEIGEMTGIAKNQVWNYLMPQAKKIDKEFIIKYQTGGGGQNIGTWWIEKNIPRKQDGVSTTISTPDTS